MAIKLLRHHAKGELPALLVLVAASVVIFHAGTLGAVIATKPFDTAWISTVRSLEEAQVPRGPVPLFAVMAWFLSGLGLSIVHSITVTAFATFLATSLLAHFTCLTLTQDRKAATLAGLLVLTYPAYVKLVQLSWYSHLLGLFALSTSALVLPRLYTTSGHRAVAALALLSALTAAAEPTAGLLLSITTLAFFTMLAVARGERRRALVALASLPAALIYFALPPPQPTLPSVDAHSPLTLGLAAIGGAAGFAFLYTRKVELLRWHTLPLWAVAALSISLTPRVPLDAVYAYLPFPLLVLTSIAVHGLKGEVIKVSKLADEEDVAVEIDVPRFAWFIVTILLLLSSLSSVTALRGQLLQTYGESIERYGDEELLDALEWIKANTLEGALIVAEYPLSIWIELYSLRETLTNVPIAYSQDPTAFIRSYDADTILNTNFEIRNEFIRVRDWECVAPQRAPAFAASNGETYIDFLYIDENHATVTYSLGGAVLRPDFYSYESKTSEWVERNEAKAVLRHIYAIDDVTITKTITVERGKAEAVVDYLVMSAGQSKILGFSVKLWIPWERKIGLTKVSGKAFEGVTDAGRFRVIFEGKLTELTFGPDGIWTQPRVLAKFAPTGNEVKVRIIVKLLEPEPISWAPTGLVTVTCDELMAKYEVAYIVVPTIVKEQFLDRFGLDYPRFVSLYENSKLTVYKVIIRLT